MEDKKVKDKYKSKSSGIDGPIFSSVSQIDMLKAHPTNPSEVQIFSFQFEKVSLDKKSILGKVLTKIFGLLLKLF